MIDEYYDMIDNDIENMTDDVEVVDVEVVVWNGGNPPTAGRYFTRCSDGKVRSAVWQQPTNVFGVGDGSWSWTFLDGTVGVFVLAWTNLREN